MTIETRIQILATLLFAIVLAPLPGPADAHTAGPALAPEITAVRMLSTGPLNIVVFEVSRR